MLILYIVEETGKVISVTGPVARVLVEKKSACDKCAAGTCIMGQMGAEMEALNEAGAEVGQIVKVVLRPYSYIKGTMMVYGVPTIAIILGAILGKEYFAPMFEGSDPDMISAIFAIGLFAASIVVVKIWSNRAEKMVEYKPVVEEILNTP